MKKGLLILPLTLGALSLVSCEGGAGGGGDNTLHVEFWHTFGDKPEDALKTQVERFEELVLANEGVKVKVDLVYQGAYKDIPQKVNNGVRDGTLPQMLVAYPDHVANYMALEGTTPGKYIVNLDNFINDPNLKFGKDAYYGDNKDVDDIIPSFLDEGRHMPRQGTYVLPYMKSTEILIYNLDAAEYIVPQVFSEVTSAQVETFMKTISWDQLMQIAEKAVEIKNKESLFNSLEYPVYYDSDSNFFITELYQKNIGYSSVQNDGTGKIEFESGENLTAAKNMVTELKNFHDRRLLTTKGTEGTYASNNFKEGKSLFTIGSTGGTGYTIPSSDTFRVGFAKVPVMGTNSDYQRWISQGPSICFMNNPSLDKSVNDQKLKYAWKLAKFITSTEVNTTLCVDGSEGYSPVRTSCYSTETYNDFAQCGSSYANAAYVTQNDINGRYYNSAVFVGSATLRDQVGALISSVFSGKATVDAAFEAAISATKKDMR